VIQFSNSFHPLSHQVTMGFGFPRHLPKQSTGKQSSKAVAEDHHVQPGQSFFYQQPVKNETDQRDNHDDQYGKQAAAASPKRFNRKFIFSHNSFILEQSS
jgi:hypothetical protein